MKKFLEKCECWRQTLLGNIRSSININEAELNKLRKHFPRFEKLFRRIIPSNYIEDKSSSGLKRSESYSVMDGKIL